MSYTTSHATSPTDDTFDVIVERHEERLEQCRHAKSTSKDALKIDVDGSRKMSTRASHGRLRYEETKLGLEEYLHGFVKHLADPLNIQEMGYIITAFEVFENDSDDKIQAKALIYLIYVVPRWFRKLHLWWQDVGRLSNTDLYAGSKKILKTNDPFENLLEVLGVVSFHKHMLWVADKERFSLMRGHRLGTEDEDKLWELENVDDIYEFMADKLVKY
ncbi:hypothetical protein DM02DRAFT_662499 [Periconia macrospinosa]|uniref:Uncharacterized protein n=1 Tax=Periconia macrospinosa TaxID=97972 RepID=A0A2V1D6M3_9PLEO|nr:hypothetical protein DM02DRAFT_662499 [Periconia macrospinosa]